jgi:Zn-finger protein
MPEANGGVLMDKERSQQQQPQREYWHGKAFAFFTNKECEFFPCHTGIDPEEFNCLFCYCPLYALGDKCGGRFTYVNDIKDCSNCVVPHRRDNYGYITGRFNEIVEAMKRIRQADS